MLSRLERRGKNVTDNFEEMAPVKAYVALANDTGFPHEGYIDFVDNEVDSSTGTIEVPEPATMALLGLAGLGVYLGRFLRWNSWDLFLHPRGVLSDVVTRLADPLAHPQALGVTCLFAAILFVCYLALAPREPA